ncbi:tRNA-splicing endonuclease subunit Sen34-like [Dysidea avara]|uniref:tRNA-splicing endonuclease subunit Sen34-like n=1 Tax=Dysidea avara TaxID=196820 RepID=UPI003319974A
MIVGRVVDENRVLIWNAEDAYKLRKDHRIVGNYVGALPCKPRQDVWLGLPLELMPEETTLLLEQGVLRLHEAQRPPLPNIHSTEEGVVEKKLKMSTDDHATVDRVVRWSFPQTPQEELHYKVFRDLWTKGYYLTAGLKYGGDYLVYPGDPFLVHSHYVAIVKDSSEVFSTQQLILAGRVTTKVKKNVLLCSQNTSNGELVYITVQWTGIT